MVSRSPEGPGPARFYQDGHVPTDYGDEEMIARRAGFGIVLVISLGVLNLPALGQEAPFEWSRQMAGGQTLEVKGIVGDMEAVFTSGDRVEVVAVKRGEEEDFHQVAVEVAEDGDRIVICAVYGSWNHGEGHCHPDHRDSGDSGDHRNVDMDVSVDYTIRLPAGVNLEGVLVAGDIIAQDLRSDVSVTTVDGNISVATTERARAKTVSGDMEIEMGDFQGQDLEFNTVSGDITLWLPADFSADVDFSSLSGDFETDFDMRVTREQSKWVGSSIEGTIGGGGRDLSLSTISGDVRLKRRG
jgi:hypothetical protein